MPEVASTEPLVAAWATCCRRASLRDHRRCGEPAGCPAGRGRAIPSESDRAHGALQLPPRRRICTEACIAGWAPWTGRRESAGHPVYPGLPRYRAAAERRDQVPPGPSRAHDGRLAGNGRRARSGSHRGSASYGPPGAPEDVREPFTPARRRRDVPCHVHVLVTGDPSGIERVDVGGEAVDHTIVLGLERAEHPVPHDEDAGVVAI